MKNEVVAAAHAEVGRSYEQAVNVSTFTWKMFYLRGIAVISGAAYAAFQWGQPLPAAGALLVSAATTWFVTRVQMKGNQRVVQKALASGFLLELQYEELGFKYRHDIHVTREERERLVIETLKRHAEVSNWDRFAYFYGGYLTPRILRHLLPVLEEQRQRVISEMIRKYRATLKEEEALPVVTLVDQARFGVYPNLEHLAMMYTATHLAFAVYLLAWALLGFHLEGGFVKLQVMLKMPWDILTPV